MRRDLERLGIKGHVTRAHGGACLNLMRWRGLTGITNSMNIALTLGALKEVMITVASKVYLVADSSKINKSCVTRLGPLAVVHDFPPITGFPMPKPSRRRDCGLTATRKIATLQIQVVHPLRPVQRNGRIVTAQLTSAQAATRRP